MREDHSYSITENETTEDVRNSVNSIIEESGCDIPVIASEIAHRVGKYNPSRKNVRPVIVRFTTVRHRLSNLKKTCLKMGCIFI